MMVRNPALVVCFLCQCPSCHSRPISSNSGYLFSWAHGAFGTTRGTLGALTTLATALGLWKESFDPSAVDKVKSSRKGGKQDKIQENSRRWLIPVGVARIGKGCLHLRIEDTRRSFHDRYRLIVCWNLIDSPLSARNNSNQIQP